VVIGEDDENAITSSTKLAEEKPRLGKSMVFMSWPLVKLAIDFA
jgi:hypothetical protein